MLAWISLASALLSLAISVATAAVASFFHHRRRTNEVSADDFATLVRQFRELEDTWQSYYSKMRSHLGRIVRADQVARGLHKGGNAMADSQETPLQPPLETTPEAGEEDLSEDQLWERVRRLRGGVR